VKQVEYQPVSPAFKNKFMQTGKFKITTLMLLAAISFSACKDEPNEDLTNTVNKNGSVESAVTVEHLDSLNDVLITKHVVWYRGQQLKNILYRDTVPSLGVEKTTAENADGDTKNVQVKKDYEIFITVK
jgi:hypothetical protein